MVEVLSILGTVTKEIGQGKLSMSFCVDIYAKVDIRAERFSKKLAGMKDVEDALQRMEKLTQDEALMAAAEGLTITREISDKIEGVDKGELYCVVLLRIFPQRFTRLGVKANGAAVQKLVNQLSDLKR